MITVRRTKIVSTTTIVKTEGREVGTTETSEIVESNPHPLNDLEKNMLTPQWVKDVLRTLGVTP